MKPSDSIPADFTTAQWRNEPTQYVLQPECLRLTTEPGTDLWQRSFYGFRVDNAPALLWECRDNLTLTARARFDYRQRFDQCGLLVVLDANHWLKVSIEYEDATHSRLGSVVTNHGYSDWASSDIPTTTEHWYRLSRRGPDFLIEHSDDGCTFRQMRVCHLNGLGETTADMARLPPEQLHAAPIRIGVYACSPQSSFFEACFDHCSLIPSQWQAHDAD